MDQVSNYRQIIKALIMRYAQIKPAKGDIEIETIFDEANDHYEMMYTGWDGHWRIHGPVLHLDIRNSKVWIQHDGIAGGIAEELVEAGIPRHAIVLGFQPPKARPYTEYAAA
ncbi:MAG: XisI protein [Chloroflexota bacterium]|nr:XisI protein [Chloroflexota bacterium]